MLRKFLRLAFGRDTTETANVARELGISVQQVRLMMDTLERLGYLEKVAAGCEQSCACCAQYPACLPNESPQIWKLTGKGERYLAADSETRD
jgi:predicted ArsR family transcriptional regulator